MLGCFEVFVVKDGLIAPELGLNWFVGNINISLISVLGLSNSKRWQKIVRHVGKSLLVKINSGQHTLKHITVQPATETFVVAGVD